MNCLFPHSQISLLIVCNTQCLGLIHVILKTCIPFLCYVLVLLDFLFILLLYTMCFFILKVLLIMYENFCFLIGILSPLTINIFIFKLDLSMPLWCLFYMYLIYCSSDLSLPFFFSGDSCVFQYSIFSSLLTFLLFLCFCKLLLYAF